MTALYCQWCALPLDPDDAHYPHDPDCPNRDDCDCEAIACPDCCPTCKEQLT